MSSYKSQEKARQAKKAAGQAPGGTIAISPVRQVSRPTTVQTPPNPKAAGATGSMVYDLSAIKGLVAKLGVEEVKKIAELFG